LVFKQHFSAVSHQKIIFNPYSLGKIGSPDMAYTHSDIEGALPLLASGKVRDLYEVDPSTLLFVATDRISAYDVIMKNVSPSCPLQIPKLFP
jgi:SAICAR synthetase